MWLQCLKPFLSDTMAVVMQGQSMDASVPAIIEDTPWWVALNIDKQACPKEGVCYRIPVDFNAVHSV